MIKEFFIIFCLWVWLTKSFNITSGREELIAESLSKLIKKVYPLKGFNVRFVTSVNNENVHKLNEVLSMTIPALDAEFPFIIQTIESLKPLKDNKRVNFFMVDSFESFKVIFLKLDRLKFRMRKLATIVALNPLSENEIQEIFNYCKTRFMIYMDVLTPNENSMDLFTYFPFSENNPCGCTKPVKVNSFNSKWEKENIKYKKSRNMHGCPLKIGAAALSTEPGVIVTNTSEGYFELTGIEKEIFDEFSKRLNFKADYQIFQSQVGKVFENDTGTGVLGKVLSNDIEVAIGLISLQMGRVRYFTESWYYTMAALSIVGNFFLKNIYLNEF